MIGALALAARLALAAVPGGALNSGPPGTSLTGTGNFTDGKVVKGRYDSPPTASTSPGA